MARSDAQIRQSVVQFLSSLLSSDRGARIDPHIDFPIPRVQAADNEALKMIPSREEIKDVVFSLSVDGAPGPDGFGAGFYQSCWPIIQEDLYLVVKDFFSRWAAAAGLLQYSYCSDPESGGYFTIEGLSAN